MAISPALDNLLTYGVDSVFKDDFIEALYEPGQGIDAALIAELTAVDPEALAQQLMTDPNSGYAQLFGRYLASVIDSLKDFALDAQEQDAENEYEDDEEFEDEEEDF